MASVVHMLLRSLSRGARVVVNDFGSSLHGEGLNQSVAQRVVDEIESLGGIAIANHDSVPTPQGGQAIVQSLSTH